MSVPTPAAEPLLRTLAPALSRLGGQLQTWVQSPRQRPLSTLAQATFDGLLTDLERQAAALDVERPLLLIMLMGGTGVGKSSLLNALAGAPVAQASYSRPTTREPVVYYHETIKPDRLDRALHQCRLAPHRRDELAQKIIVDTPDLDSNEPANREKLKDLLPVADVVLYVGSQEKYHDQLGWELFLEQRRRRAFAFVLNKWDRCLHGGGQGLRPDEDLLRDLKQQGFDRPLLFRTCAQAWVEANGRPPEDLPVGEQFRELVHWLELGLTRLEIEAIKARGVSQLLAQLERTLDHARPPDLAAAAAKTQQAWEQALAEEASAVSDILLATIEPYQREIEHHFAMEGHRRFRGMMGSFMSLMTRIRYLGSSLRGKLPWIMRAGTADASPPAWDLAEFSRTCTSMAAERHLDARGRALPNRLLIQADQEGFPVDLLSDRTEAAAQADWRARFTAVLIEVLHEVESQWARPTGPRRWLQTLFVLLGEFLPWLALVGSFLFLGYEYFLKEPARVVAWTDMLLPFIAILLTLGLLYVLIVLVLPIRWPAIRGTFHRDLTRRLGRELESAYLPLPAEVAAALAAERRHIGRLVGEAREVGDWLKERELAANIEGLYGS